MIAQLSCCFFVSHYPIRDFYCFENEDVKFADLVLMAIANRYFLIKMADLRYST